MGSRHHSTGATSPLPGEHRHKMIREPTRADAILDRLVHNDFRSDLDVVYADARAENIDLLVGPCPESNVGLRCG